jgi:hypothetical protein
LHITKVLDPLEKLETKISELYEWFSSIFADDAEAASLFYRISIDETAHANLVRYQRRLAAQNSKIFGDVSLEPGAVNAALDMAASVLSGAPPSLEEAVKIALDLEKNIAEAHYIAAIAQASPEMSRLLSSLRGFDSRHSEVFEKFAAGRGFPFAAGSGPAPKRQEAPAGPDDRRETLIRIPPEVLEKIQYYYEWHKTMDFYKLLGIKDYASSDQIKKAFRSRAREFHPDSYMNAAEDVQRKLHVIFSYMTHAYSTLTDPVRRQEYDMARTRSRK